MNAHLPYCPAHGFLRPGCLGILICIGGLWGGGQAVYTALKNRTPMVMSCQDYIAKRPSAEWLTLTNAKVSVFESAYMTRFGVPSELYIPLRPMGEADEKPVHVLIESKDKDLLNAVAGVNKAKDPETAFIEVMVKNKDKFFKAQEVTGLIQFGVDADTKTRKKLRGLHMNLSPDFVILKEGEKPDLSFGIIALLLSLGLGVFLVKRALRTEEAPPPPPNLPERSMAGPPPLPPR